MTHGEDYVSTGRHRISFHASKFDGDKPYKPARTIDSENLEICLNCDKPKCKGYCEKLKRRTDNENKG